MSESGRRCAVVAILGAPNAGKSTLVNRLVGQKIAIVTHKVQTTRAPLRGVAVRGDTQLVLVDTPGVFTPRRTLERAMVRAAWNAGGDADVIVHLVDAPAFAKGLEGRGDGADALANADTQRIVAWLREGQRRALLALNKVDAMARPALLAVAAALHGENAYDEVFMISAATGDGVEDIASALVARAKPGPWLYPEDQAADAPLRVLAAEITREKAMLRLHDELPYQLAVETDRWLEQKDGSVRIEQTVLVARENHRRMAIGKGGASLKVIGFLARTEMEAAFDRRVHLFLHVKVREGWSEDRGLLRSMGLQDDG